MLKNLLSGKSVFEQIIFANTGLYGIGAAVDSLFIEREKSLIENFKIPLEF